MNVAKRVPPAPSQNPMKLSIASVSAKLMSKYGKPLPSPKPIRGIATIQANDRKVNVNHKYLGIPKIEIKIARTAKKATAKMMMKYMRYIVSPPTIYSSWKPGRYAYMNCSAAPATPIK